MNKYRASTHYRLDLQPTERAHKLTELLHRVANLILEAIQKRNQNSHVLSLVNSSEFYHFLKSDRQISVFSVHAQEVLIERVQTNDLTVVSDRILSHVWGVDVISSKSTPNSTGTASPTLSKYALWIEPRDVWCIKLDPVWIDGVIKSVSFVDAVPITLRIHSRSVEKLNLNILNIGTSTIQSFASFPLNNGVPLSAGNQSYVPDETNPSYMTGPLDYDDVVSDSESTTVHAKPSKQDVNEFSMASAIDDIASADLNVIARISKLFSVQIDRYQYLFLLRMAEEMTELTTFDGQDSKRILQNHSKNKSVLIRCVVEQVEVTMVMPSQRPSKESGVDESSLPDSASLGDNSSTTSHIPSASGNWNSGNAGVALSLNQMNVNIFGSTESPSSVANEAPDSFYQQFDAPPTVQLTSSPNVHGHNVRIVSTATNMTKTSTTSSQNTTTVQSNRGRIRNSIIETGLKDIGSSLVSMKRRFSNFMTSIDSALKTNQTDDMGDTTSIQSDISLDSENFIMVLSDDKPAVRDVPTDVMFRLNPFTAEKSSSRPATVEVASEVCEEIDYKTKILSPSEPSEGSTWRRRDLLSMATFRLPIVELIRQNRGQTLSIRMQVAALSCDECGAIPWNKLQTSVHLRNIVLRQSRNRAFVRVGETIRVIENPYWKPVEDIEKVHKRRAEVPNAPARAMHMRNIDLTKKPKPPLSRVPLALESTKEQLHGTLKAGLASIFDSREVVRVDVGLAGPSEEMDDPDQSSAEESGKNDLIIVSSTFARDESEVYFGTNNFSSISSSSFSPIQQCEVAATNNSNERIVSDAGNALPSPLTGPTNENILPNAHSNEAVDTANTNPSTSQQPNDTFNITNLSNVSSLPLSISPNTEAALLASLGGSF